MDAFSVARNGFGTLERVDLVDFLNQPGPAGFMPGVASSIQQVRSSWVLRESAVHRYAQ